jgi:hypothetical protein
MHDIVDIGVNLGVWRRDDKSRIEQLTHTSHVCNGVCLRTITTCTHHLLTIIIMHNKPLLHHSVIDDARDRHAHRTAATSHCVGLRVDGVGEAHVAQIDCNNVFAHVCTSLQSLDHSHTHLH